MRHHPRIYPDKANEDAETSGNVIDILVTPAIAEVLDRARQSKAERGLNSDYLFVTRENPASLLAVSTKRMLGQVSSTGLLPLVSTFGTASFVGTPEHRRRSGKLTAQLLHGRFEGFELHANQAAAGAQSAPPKGSALRICLHHAGVAIGVKFNCNPNMYD